jgi:hypothetical protein
MTIKGMESRGKRNTQVELRKTFIGRMGFIHEWMKPIMGFSQLVLWQVWSHLGLKLVPWNLVEK